MVDYELLNVAWVTASVVAGTGALLMALAMLCKAAQRCRLRYRRRRRRAAAAAAAAAGKTADGSDGGCAGCCQLPTASAAAAAAATAAAVAATAASTAANVVAAAAVGHQHASQQPRQPIASADTFDDFLQLSFNSREPTTVQQKQATATANGPRSPRSRVAGIGLERLQQVPSSPGRFLQPTAKPAGRGASGPDGSPHQHTVVSVDTGRPAAFGIYDNHSDEEDASYLDGCSEAGRREATPAKRPAAVMAATTGDRATTRAGSGAYMYDSGYDMEWPPASSSSYSRLGFGDHGAHTSGRGQHQPQQQQQGRRAHIFFGRGGGGAGSRYGGNM